MKIETGEIIKNNKLIAEFMGYVFIDEYSFKTIKDGRVYDRGLLNYCSSWDELMSVVEKIESVLDTGFNVVIKNDKCRIYRHKGSQYEQVITKLYEGGSKIESTYLAVVEFINYFNETFSEEEKRNLLK